MQTHIERPEAKFFHYVLPAMASQASVTWA